jgi:hypothetical protein
MITPSELEPIAVAVPSFVSEWRRVIVETLHDPTLICVEFQLALCEHLVEHAVVGDFDEFPCLFDALDKALGKPSPELYDELTAGLLNCLMGSCEDRGIDLARVAACITGSTARGEWNVSYRRLHQDREPPWL